MTSGMVFDVQRFSLHDGPGIRTTFFLKGCPLSCRWCHNPEAMASAAEILVTAERCIACGECAEVCPLGLPSAIDGGWARPRALCEACGLCAEACPTGARRLAGREMSVPEAVAEGLRDRIFYEASGGGVTFSGGEPLRQADFVIDALEQFRKNGVHTAVDTCGQVDRGVLLDAARVADLFLYDIKHMDDRIHREWAGASNVAILDNLRALARVHCAIWVRVPVIPGVNDDSTNLESTAAFVAGLPGVQRVSLLPYHRLGAEKRARISAPGQRAANPEVAALEEPTADQIAAAAAVFEAAGLQPTIGG